jgi:hypothetical protein
VATKADDIAKVARNVEKAAMTYDPANLILQ